ncbi:MAG: hypothetical protein AAFY28_12775 [Actinomycetota bacterium]
MGKQLEIRIGIGSMLWLVAAATVGVVTTLIVTSAWQANAAPGDTDTTYNPTAGCRITDTRGPNNIGPRSTPLGEGEVMEVMIRGDNGECVDELRIPGDATGIALNVTATDATEQSNIRVYPGDLDEVPLLSNLNVFAGAAPQPNKVDVQLSPDGTIKVFNFRGSVHIVIDVVGFYTPESLRTLADLTNPENGSFTLTHGFGPTIPNNGDPATISHLKDYLIVGAPAGTTRAAGLPLTAPVQLLGGKYALRWVRICVDASTSGRVDRVEVHGWEVPPLGQSPTSFATLIAEDDADITTARCRNLEIPEPSLYDSYHVTVWVRSINVNTGVRFFMTQSGWS